MNYRELMEITRKHPNPFWNREQHDKEVELRYRDWVIRQNRIYEARKAQEKANRQS